MKLVLKILTGVIIVLAVIFIINIVRDTKTVTIDNDNAETASVSSPPPTETPTTSPTESASPSESPSSTPYSGPVSPLSGLPVDNDTVNKRPYAIMLDNAKSAQPLLGLAETDMIFEIPVEGGITRLMALFQDMKDVGHIGSVRSARPYFVEIASGYDAIYIHAGGSAQAYNIIKSTGITHFDGVNGSKHDIFYRDASRKKQLGFEHSLVTSGELINKFLPTYGVTLEHSSGYDVGMTFQDNAAPENGSDTAQLTVNFASGRATGFVYDQQTALYGVSQFGKAYNDGNTGTQLSVRNVLVLYTSINNIAGDKAGRLEVDVTGKGSGTFFCGGKSVKINWAKASDNKPFSFTTQDGAPLAFGRGITYVCITNSSSNVKIG